MKSYEGNYVEIKLKESGKVIKDSIGNPIIKKVKEVGPYFYLKDQFIGKPIELTKMIGGRNVDITIKDVDNRYIYRNNYCFMELIFQRS